jgi:N-acetylmuramoyl-L-alanine amidase
MSRFSGRSNLSAALQGTRLTVLPPIDPVDARLRSEIPKELEQFADFGSETLQEISSRLQGLIRLTGVAIAINQVDEQGSSVVCVASSGPSAPPLGTVLERSRGLSAECWRTRETKVSNDTSVDPRVNWDACRQNGVRSTVVLPLLINGEPIGILGVFSDRPGYFSERQIFLLEFVASFISHSSAMAPARPRRPFATQEALPVTEASAEAAPSAAPESGLPSKRFLLSIAAGVLVMAGAVGLFHSRRGSNSAKPAAATSGESGDPAASPGAGDAGTQVGGKVLGTGASIAGSVDHWSTPGYTRITIRLDRERATQCERLPDPERLYCDFHGLTVPRDYEGEDFAGDPLVGGVRAGQYRPDVARVVFDLKAASARHAVAVLTNPPRLMVEVMELSKMGIKQSSAKAPATEEPPSADSALQPTAAREFTIVIDPGHGGRDTGTIGPAGLKEKDLVLDVARQLGKMLRTRLGARVILTRTTDQFLSLEKRSEIANRAGADLFLSIHGNGSDYAPAEGIETYYMGEPASAKDAHVAETENQAATKAPLSPHLQLAAHTGMDRAGESQQFAQDVQEALYRAAAQAGTTRNRGVRTAPFVVLKDAFMPAILAEISFLSSKAEERRLMQAEHRQALADGLFQGIANHLAGSKKVRTRTVSSAALQ